MSGACNFTSAPCLFYAVECMWVLLQNNGKFVTSVIYLT